MKTKQIYFPGMTQKVVESNIKGSTLLKFNSDDLIIWLISIELSTCLAKKNLLNSFMSNLITLQSYQYSKNQST